MLRPFIVIGFLSGATGALADPVPLANDELKKTVAGSIVEIDTPLGTTVPMRFGNDGLVAAEAGVLAPVLGAAKDRGRWWVEGDKLCTKWFRWFDAGVRCLTIARDGSRIYWRKIDDGETGTGTLVTEPEEKTVVAARARTTPARRASKPEPERRATRLAAPPRETPATAPPAADPRPAVVASAEPDAASEETLEEGPAMRFGGAGLLGASSLAAPPAKSPSVPPAEKAEASHANTAPPRDIAGGATASGKAVKKATEPRRASLPANSNSAKRTSRRAASKAREVATATSSSRAVALYRVVGVAGYDVLNVRRGPSERYVSIAAIPSTGREVEITGQCRADWCPIRYGAITGWVNSYYLAEEGARQDFSGDLSFVRR